MKKGLLHIENEESNGFVILTSTENKQVRKLLANFKTIKIDISDSDSIIGRHAIITSEDFHSGDTGIGIVDIDNEAEECALRKVITKGRAFGDTKILEQLVILACK